MEQFVKQLYDPLKRPSPAEIGRLGVEISKLQREHSGWRLGLDLLHNEDNNLRFYGALTLTIKINNDWEKDSLDRDERLRGELLEQILSRIVYLTNTPATSYVMRKFTTTLSSFFLKEASEWRLPIRHVLTCMLMGKFIPLGEVYGSVSLALGSGSISYHQLRAILWLCLALVEDALRSDLKGPSGLELRNRLLNNMEDVWDLLDHVLQSLHKRFGHLRDSEFTSRDIADSVHTGELLDITKDQIFPAAMAWSKFALSDTSITQFNLHKHIDRSMTLVTQCFSIPLLGDSVVEFLAELAQYAPAYIRSLGQGIEAIVHSTQAQNWVASLLSGHFSQGAMSYAELLAGLMDLEDLAEPGYLANPVVQHILETLPILLGCKGAAVVEDEVCQLILESLSQITDGYNEWEKPCPADEYMQDLIRRSCGICIHKIEYPTQQMDDSTKDWDVDDRSKFQEFRNDVADFLLSAFAALGPPLIEFIIATVHTSGSNSGWERYEASLSCLAGFSDVMDANPERYDVFTSQIFSTTNWSTIVQNSTPVPTRVRQGSINYISKSTGYLQRNPSKILPCLEFLFSSLQLASSVSAASRAIYTLCYTQRTLLVEALPKFIGTLRGLPPIPLEDKHRIFSAVAALIQALPTEDQKAEALAQMLIPILQKFESLEGLFEGRKDSAFLEALDVLQSLAAIGKGVRAATNATIDLDALEHPSALYWTNGDGRRFQKAALKMLHDIVNEAELRFSGQIIDAACDFIKSGYTEEHPSPFKFLPMVSTEFFVAKIHLSTPNLITIMATASAFLASNKPEALTTELDMILHCVVDAQRTILTNFSMTKHYADHEFTFSSLDFLARLLPRWGSRLLTNSKGNGILPILIEFALLTLQNPDTLPRRSAAAFWTAILDLSGYPTTPPADATIVLASLLDAYASRFTATLVRLLAGECARSELDALTEPLKKLVAKQPQRARPLLREVMKPDAGALSERALASTTLEARTRFVDQVERLRGGGRKTGELVRAFWVDCRGAAAFGYTA